MTPPTTTELEAQIERQQQLIRTLRFLILCLDNGGPKEMP